jgi:hypothetical protein
MIDIVWIPQSTVWEEPEERWCEQTEQAGDAALGGDDPLGLGPMRTTKYDATTFEIMEQKWTFRGVTWTAPESDETPSINAWAAWQQAPPEEPIEPPLE